MTSQSDTLALALRERILAGEFRAGAHLPESTLAERLGASRTPVRLALATLEREGLVLRLPNRGYRVRGFSIDEIVDAVKLRAELEAMAARRLAEAGLPEAVAARLRETMREAEAILARPTIGLDDRRGWTESNRAFHAAIVEAAGSRPLAETYAHVCSIPLAAPQAIVFDQTQPDYGRGQIARAQQDHDRILSALVRREGARAEALTREHGYMSAENKRANLLRLGARQVDRLPGLGLVDLEQAVK